MKLTIPYDDVVLLAKKEIEQRLSLPGYDLYLELEIVPPQPHEAVYDGKPTEQNETEETTHFIIAEDCKRGDVVLQDDRGMLVRSYLGTRVFMPKS